MTQELKQVIYDHGGSRIYLAEKDDSDRELLVDTYHTEEFAIAVRDFVSKWLSENPMREN